MQSRSLPFTDLFNINTSSPSTSCSVQSSPNVGNALQSSSTTHNPKKQKIKNGDAYVEAVESIAQSLKMPLTPVTPVNVATDSTDPVDTCMNFLGSLIKNIRTPDLKLDIMNTLVQTVVNASLTDLERVKK
ncbi:uncharacterized protein LOC118648473 [Monomorium pharaonis]|uniref:uncharacterized protein LOC118648473 n=1 Tax=Monomorium pharaonis TaxID=307658 RepID=UPI0017475970|nr:uncharacterized protein LOC118648473 [Monomorium pharaonis]